MTDEQVANSVYEIPEYLCYSSTDLVNWKSEGTVMTMDTVDWAKDDVSAWASQVMKYKRQVLSVLLQLGINPASSRSVWRWRTVRRAHLSISENRLCAVL